MNHAADLRTRSWVRRSLWASVAATLVGAGATGWWFSNRPMDQVLVQLTFYGAWAALLGSYLGGRLGAMVEEDACREMDMGVTSSMGAFVGAVAWSIVGNALPGLALTHRWDAVLLGFGLLTVAVAGVDLSGFKVWRRPGFDPRGRRVDPDGREQDVQPSRMRDRFTVVVTLAMLVLLGLVAWMAVRMGGDLGHPVMLAPMMYSMTGGMVGGILGGWLAGLLDEHRGAPEHENSMMIAAMALMSGMMGAMPAAMVASMLAVMGDVPVGVTTAAGLALGLGSVWILLRGRYTLRRAGGDEDTAPEIVRRRAVGDDLQALTLRVTGMTCGACGRRVTRRLAEVPGVAAVQVDVEAGLAEITIRDTFPGVVAAAEALEEIGYPLA